MSDTIIAYLDRVQAVTDAATPGPWTANYDEADEWTSITGQGHYDGGGWLVCPEVATCEGEPGPDASLIAAARTDMDMMAKALRAVIEAHRPVHTDVAPYGVCWECCTRALGYQTEECLLYHQHTETGHYCGTIRAIEAVIPGE